MTRINAGIHPSELPDKLLLAEHREITRIPNAVKSGRAKIVDIPIRFTLGKGHVKFFYDKLGYLAKRYDELYLECTDRGFNVTCKRSAFFELRESLRGDYTASQSDRTVVVERIRERGFELRGQNEG